MFGVVHPYYLGIKKQSTTDSLPLQMYILNFIKIIFQSINRFNKNRHLESVTDRQLNNLTFVFTI